jgi:polysaccharide export outer membrane protein
MTFRLLSLLLLLVSPISAQEVEKKAYVLRPDDGISVSVYDEPDLSGKVRILKTGHASFPLIGSVEIAGLSVDVAAAKLRDLYAKDYLVDPKLTITVDEYSTDFISVIGAVKSPGQIPLPQSGVFDLASAMAQAGGLTPNADSKSITLIRAAGGSSTFSESAIQGGGAAGRTKLAPGDRIIVGESSYVGKKVLLLGQVQKPGPIGFPINGKLDLLTALASAGGLTPLANPKKVSINRKGQVILLDYKEISQHGDKPFFLEPDDIISVAERLF